MRKILLLSVLLLLMIPPKVFSQMEIPHLGYNMVPTIYNPASSSFSDGFSVHGSYQNYWMGFDNAPEALNFNIFGNIGNNMGVSFNLHRTNINIFNQNQVEGGYSYRIQLSPGSLLSFGLSLGIRKLSAMQSTNVLDQYDPVLEGDVFNKSHFSAGFGMSYQWKALTVDLAAPAVYFKSGFFSKYIMMVGYKVDNVEDFVFRPLIMYRRFSPIRDDIQVRLQTEYLHQVNAEIGYGNDIGFMAGLGFRIGGVMLGYSFASLSPNYSRLSGGTNSVYAIYTFKHKQIKEERVRYNLPL